MSEPAALAVTGSTGVVGGQVARLLADAGMPHRLLVRDPVRAPALPATTVHRCSYEDSAESRAALDGVRTLFMVSAAEDKDRRLQHRAFVDAADAMGVEHVVYLSYFGAGPDAVFTLARDHWDTEQHLRSSGMQVTFLRDAMYLDFFPLMAGPDGVIRGPAGDGRLAGVAQADVARAAFAVLRDPVPHRGATYGLTGPETLSLTEAAQILTEVGDRPIRFVDETLDEAWESRRAYGAPDWQVEAWISTYTAIAAGELDHVSDDVRALTGRDPLSLRQVLTG